DDVKGQLRKGDVFSNDGNFVYLDPATIPGSHETPKSSGGSGAPVPLGEFLCQERAALAGGVGVLLQRPAYNGPPSHPRTAGRGVLRPFTGRGGKLEEAAARVLAGKSLRPAILRGSRRVSRSQG